MSWLYLTTYAEVFTYFTEGCPQCVAVASCKEANIVLAKVGARIVLESILKMDLSWVDALEQDEIPGALTDGDSIIPGGAVISKARLEVEEPDES
jgi:hypothetical protein